mmetsp:Transcript_53643/g.61010  ORF Transcript_53643/g.61010 Transcript_53643/m.61010 type:complete len:157 (-) Transcript_53643:66-536(-)
MIDPVTGWFEQAQLYGKPTASRCMRIFDTTWLACYPRPREIGFNNEGEFKAEFKELTMNIGLKAKESLTWNLQSNAILERIHQVLADCLVSFELEDVNNDSDDPDPFEEYLAMALYAIRSAFHKTHGHSPGQLVFGCDINVPIDWTAIKERKQKAI